MKIPTMFFLLAFVFFTFCTAQAQTVVFTGNTDISPVNTNYDGESIVISNCTVTVDGAHTFASLVVASNGILTHSFSPNGQLTTLVNVTNEQQTLTSTNPATLVYSNVVSLLFVTDLGRTVVYTNGIDYTETNLPGGMVQIARTADSSIPDGTTVLVDYSWDDVVAEGLDLTVTGAVCVAAVGSINANAIGYGGAQGPGSGRSSGGAFFDASGAGDGGNGGMSASNAVGGLCYDSLYQPAALGSGGGSSYAGSGGNGGGLIQIVAGGNVEIDGVVSANGGSAMNSRAGGGSGGGIWISAASVSGAGTVSANGGAGAPVYGGGGGGGRIAVICGTNNFSGSITAYGGSGATYGGAGTIYTQVASQTGLVLVNNGGNAGTNSSFALPTLADVVVSGDAGVVAYPSFSPRNVTISANSTLTTLAQSLLYLTVSNLTIQAGGALVVNSLGDGLGVGFGNTYTSGGYTYAGGGGYGGYGGAGAITNASGGSPYYNSVGGPTQFGSDGGGTNSGVVGGAGGGAVELNVSGTLDVDGAVTANGGNGPGIASGGGSGGSIFLQAGSFSGAGAITANGGAGANSRGGGGGGGRIAIIANANSFTGAVNCYGGAGANPGGAGTVYLQTGGGIPELLMDNGGVAGPPTPIENVSGENLVIQNGALGLNSSSSAASLDSLLVASNASLTVLGGSTSGGFFITGNATIQAGGGLIANADGNSSGQGFGAGVDTGRNPYYPGGGGGNGGMGGNGNTNGASGGNAGYNSITQPTSAGSGGGGNPNNSFGGSGGGSVQMTVNGTLQLNGVISANGGNGSGIGGGGGSGGSINLAVGTLSGGGSISANGGAGVGSIGGGGGGGCIAISFTSDLFSGPITAFGGSGANYGGAGTIYLKTNSTQQAQLIVDNGGIAGAGSVIQPVPSANLTLRNNAVIDVPALLFSFGNVFISSNAFLVATNGPVTIEANNVTVGAGCGITANAGGNPQNSGPNPGRSNAQFASDPCSGGGYGGYGGNGFSNLVIGGLASFNLPNAPTTTGSGGGGVNNISIGGSGGGAIEVIVTGTLQLNGALSANGGNGSGSGGGGGSGGSLDLTVGNLTGSGVMSANGGSGAGSIGGGGGGGMIAVALTQPSFALSNFFTGTLSAYGGGGANFGGAGTIFIKTNANNQSLIIADNGGNVGTNTGIVFAGNNGLILRNGAVGCLGVNGPSFGSLLITSNAWLVPRANINGTVSFTCAGNVTVQAGGGIIADSYGPAQNIGTGHGSSITDGPFDPCSGGGHGGYGGFCFSNLVAGGVAYDSTTAPNGGGSGGGGTQNISFGGSGGGYVNLTVQSPFIATVNGVISANGGNGSGTGGGGGSGGTISINTPTLVGTGSIIANGGNGVSNIGGGGGGGRIAIVLTKGLPNTNVFGGTVTSYGGGGASYGGAGTIYYQTNPQSSFPLVVLDNNGHAGTNSSFSFNDYDVTAQNGAVGLLPSSGSWTAHNILIQSNGAMTILPTTANVTLQPNSLTIAQGGALTVDGDGDGSLSGPGSGGNSGGIYGGGGHGGYGGGNTAGGGAAYDSVQSPTNAGSGGASYSSAPGGAGGGALNIVGGMLTVNGRLSANGTSGGFNAGGGAGGSLNLMNISTLEGSLSGNGVISANGGAASGMGGGGGGGRIAVNFPVNNFTGQYSAYGGGGNYPGGAGTIYTVSAGVQTLLVNNGGIAGTNTPLGAVYALPTTPFDLDISGAASVAALNSLPLLSNLNLSAATTLTMPVAQSNLFIGVLNNANIGGNLNVDQLGYSLTNGPGAGSAVDNDGSGGGYGGAGGASSSGAAGGVTYGPAAAPLAFGSGGGNGTATVNGGSSGGGALRLSVLGTLNVTGSLSANGNAGAQDNSGGGAGGSVWITAGALSGTGNILANGGNGAPFGGGGGGGGRIAIYTPSNNFTGVTNVNGGTGDVSGQPGTIFLANAFTDFEIISQSPTGQVMNTVSSVNLGFNDMVNPGSVSASDFTLITPAGALASSNLTVAVTGPNSVQLGFPIQNLVGNYTIEAATTISNMFGVPLAVPYAGTFSISLPTISGTVSDTNGAPVAGVMIQPNGGLTGVMTGTNGSYSLGVPNGWYGTVTPSLGTNMFVPSSISYGNVTIPLTNQNYLIVPTVAPNIVSGLNGNNFTLNWNGITYVTYQVLWSTNLVNWQPLGSPLPGTNGPMQIVLPSGTNAAAFFELEASH